ALSLTTGEPDSILADDGVETSRQRAYELDRVRGKRCTLNGFARRACHCAIGDISRDPIVEQDDLLPHERNLAAQVVQSQLLDVMAIEQDAASGRFVEA